MHHHHHHHRRRKKRPNYGNRTVEVCRGLNGFGFTISGQQPCILSCIVTNSPADLAGLRAGDFLISVNGLNVSKLPHEAVVQLIGTSFGNIKMTIAENYYSDSSDDDNIVVQQNYHRVRHKYPHHNKINHNKNRMASNFNLMNNIVNMGASASGNLPIHKLKSLDDNLTEDKLSRSHNIIVSPNAPNSKDISNIRAVVRLDHNNKLPNGPPSSASSSTSNDNNTQSLEYRTIVGYLGTIEMPKQIATSSKLQTVRSCIRKMRQEKRNPTTVLMTILPNFLTLKNNTNVVIAKYPSSRLNYVSSSSENNDNKFFGLVTSQIYADGQIYDEAHEVISSRSDINISNSCHVFVIDGKLVDHMNHIDKADLFKITCTKDPISNLCLEFPSNSEYIVNLIRSMYTLKSAVRIAEQNGHLRLKSNLNFRNFNRLHPRAIDDNFHDLIANSPQPSEITTTSSNSDSGIGFHNDLSNISDRIVVVDFPRHQNIDQLQIPPVQMRDQHPPRPHAIIHEIPNDMEQPAKSIRNNIVTAATPISRLTVRAMPDPKIVNLEEKSSQTTFDEHGNLVQERPVDVPKHYESIFFNNYNIHGARSCDDIMIGYDRKSTLKFEKKMSVDDMTMLGEREKEKQNDDHVFLLPAKPLKKLTKKLNSKKLTSAVDDSSIELVGQNNKILNRDKLMNYKLSPKVFGVARPFSMSVENLTSPNHKSEKKYTGLCKNNAKEDDDDGKGSVWGSLQELRSSEIFLVPSPNFLEGTYSEPDLRDDDEYNIDDETLSANSKILEWLQTQTLNATLQANNISEQGSMEETSSINTKFHNNIKDIKAIIIKNSKGKQIIESYETNGYLNKCQRNTIIDIILENVSENNISLNQNDFSSILKQIVLLFPKEVDVQDYYFIPRSTKKNPKGKLYDKYVYSRRLRRKIDPQILENNSQNETLINRTPTIEIDLTIAEALKANLKKDTNDWSVVCDKWEKTFSLRQRDIKEKSNITFLEEWPIFKHAKTPTLQSTMTPLDINKTMMVTTHDLHFVMGFIKEDEIFTQDNNTISRSTNLGTSPFRRWGQSSLRSRTNTDLRTPLARRPSSAASENDVYTKSEDNNNVNSVNLLNGCANSDGGMLQTINTKLGPTTWSSSFEKLLSDSSGIHTFSEFLKKEFSAENIYFWCACERYSKICDRNERAKEAVEIFKKHLANGALEPVNVDSHARNATQENLQNAEKNLFLAAQKQIFNLMKFDSYARFIRSDLYKQCLEADDKSLILPYPGGEQLDTLLKTGVASATPTKLKKSLSNADDRRRKSLLPWHRKTRCKSKDRDDDLTKSTKSVGGGSIGSSSGLKVTNSGSDIHSSRSSLSSFDAAISSRNNNFDSEENRSSLCRVLLADGATTIVQTRTSETIRELVERLLEKRGICYQAYEAFLSGSNKPIELDSISSCLAGKEVQIEQRVIFKLDLPNRKVISVKSKPCKALGDVLRPILNKYNFKLDLVQVFFRESNEPLDMSLSVTVTDGQRLQVICKQNEIQTEVAQISTSINFTNQIQKVQKTLISNQTVGFKDGNQNTQQFAQLQQQQQQQQQRHLTPQHTTNNILIPFNNKNVNFCNKTTQTTQQIRLDEITNKVFNELLQEKLESHLVPPTRASDQGSTKSEDWGSETSSGIFGRLRLNRGEQNIRLNKVNKKLPTGNPKGSTTESEDGNNERANCVSGGNGGVAGDNQNGLIKKPLIAKWKAGVKLQVTTRSENHDLLEGLKRAQRSRLEDQRGTEINFELPDFLKDKENNLNNNKFRKLKESTSGPTSSAHISSEPTPFARTINLQNEETIKSINHHNNLLIGGRPQPAPRLSINSKNNSNNFNGNNNKNSNNYHNSSNDSNNLDTTLVFNHQQKTDLTTSASSSSLNYQQQNHLQQQDDKISCSTHSSFNSDNQMDSSFNSIGTINSNYEDCISENGGIGGGNLGVNFNENYGIDDDLDDFNQRGPPPLPPKPKILPIKPSNWGQNNSNCSTASSSSSGDVFKMPQEMPRRLVNNSNNININNNNMDIKQQRNVYLDQPSSSFV